ncbi:hypothetical protein UXN73_07165 [Enterobacter asburiae]|uniref:hypothetical protein n=1 Tax=Enterobacter asburiae TaxID=61645 RepID=UPI002FD2EDE6
MKRYIVFAYDTDERAAGWRDIYRSATDLREAEIFAYEARDSANCDQVEIYDLHNDALVVEWIKGVDRKWREVRAE